MCSRASGSPGSKYSLPPYGHTQSGCCRAGCSGTSRDGSVCIDTRYGLYQVCSSRLRRCVSVTTKRSGSKPGSPPCVPVRYCDQGSYGLGQNASAVGRTWTNTALRFMSAATSSQCRYSALSSSALRPVRDGQSMFTTDEIHIARSSRLRAAGRAAADVVDVADDATGASVDVAAPAGVIDPTVTDRAEPARPALASVMKPRRSSARAVGVVGTVESGCVIAVPPVERSWSGRRAGR